MAFTVEDGTGVKSANSYASLAFFKAYFDDRKEDATSIDDPDIENLLVAATDYIDTRWGRRFKGRREWRTLISRSILTLTAQPTAGETVTFGSMVYTYQVTPVADTDVEIGIDVVDSLRKLVGVIGTEDTTDYAGTRLVDEDAASVALYAGTNGVVTTETLAAGSFDVAASIGKSLRQQPLEFPRIRIHDSAGVLVVGIPDRLRAATCEYAFRANTTTLSPDPTVDPSGRVLTGSRTKVGPIETETQFADEIGTVTITKSYPLADRMLREFVFSGGPIKS